MRQLVGRGPAKLEETADVPDADQPVSGPPGLPGGFRLGDGRVWRAAHGLPLAATGPDGSTVLSSALRRGSRWLVTQPPPGRAVRRLAPAGAAGLPSRLGCSRDRVRSGQAEFGGPALDVRPEPVPLVQVCSAAVSARIMAVMAAVAVQDPAGQPGHFPAVLAAGRLPGGVGGLVAGHGGVVDGQGHGSVFGAVMVRLPGLAPVRGCVRFPGARPGRVADRAASRGAGRPRSRTRAAWWPAVVGERQVVGVLHLAHVLVAPAAGRGQGGGRLGGAVPGSRGVLPWLVTGRPPCRLAGWLRVGTRRRLGWPWWAAGAASAAWSIWSAIWS